MGNIPFNDINVFPSSNSTTHGKITAEDNLRDITTKMKLSNYIVSGLGITKNGANIDIDTGACVIDGYLITITSSFSVAYTASSNVWFKIDFDANSLIDTIVDPNDNTKIKGVEITFTDPSVDEYKYLKIGELDASGNPVPTFTPNYFPFSSDSIAVPDSNGIYNTSLTDYVENVATGEFLSKINNDTKKGNVVFNNNNDNKTVTIDSGSVVFKDDTTTLLEITGGIINADGNINTVVSGDVSTIADEITLTVNGMSIVLKNEGGQNKIVIGNLTLTIGVDQVDIACPSTVNISANNTNITGDLTVNGTITGTKVYGAVFN